MPLPVAIRRISEPSQETPRSLRGTFAGYVSPGEIPVKSVQQLIPRGSGITPLDSRGKKTLPAIYLFGKQRCVRNVWGSWEFQYGFGLEYDEVLMIIPNLQLPESTELPAIPRVTLYSRIFLNSICSSVLGRFMYGLSKHHGRFEFQPGRFRTLNRHGHQIFEADIKLGEGAVSEDSVNAIRELLATPVVFAGRLNKSSGCALSIRQFDYEVSAEAIQPIETTITVDEKFTKKIPTQTFQTVGLDLDPNGSFQCEFPWVMTDYRPAA
ncbi:hypothetical protein OAK47_02125 [Planctomycetaceae bacterium]|jgi:hypothetical protein|nr:hypothetical protein [Planctomycetaceae bacterium]MDG2390970.1 hypothetical protein [Planctomycetaceae bacterium]